MSCAIVLIILSVVDVFHSAVLYYTLVAGVVACVSLPILAFYFQQDFISWLIVFIGQHYVKVSVFFTHFNLLFVPNHLVRIVEFKRFYFQFMAYDFKIVVIVVRYVVSLVHS